MTYIEEFPLRLARLRAVKGVSAREMSLSLGQNPGYIQNIESGHTLPSLIVFFNICEYLGVKPEEFFQDDQGFPQDIHDIIACLKKMNREEISAIKTICTKMMRRK